MTPRWAAVPPGSGRWLLPTSPRRAAATGLRIYHPVTIKGLVGWTAARVVATSGGFGLLRAQAAPPPEVTESLASRGISYRSLALARANHPARFLVLLLGDSSEPVGVAKIALDAAGTEALHREAAAIDAAARLLRGRVRPPRLLRAAEGLLLLEPIDWTPRVASWRLPGEVAHELGKYSRAAGEAGGAGVRAAHGDLAPWNLLRSRDGWVLLDWEHSAASRPPFFDFWHYLLQAHSLLGRPSTKTLLDGVKGRRGWIRSAMTEYARGSGNEPGDAVSFLDDYIRASAAQLAGRSQKEREGLNARLRLQRQISAADLTK